jgi:ketosteroid isomerase-like protein
MTSHSNADIYAVVRRYADAWAANDLAGVIDSYHDDIVFHYFGNNPLAGVHRANRRLLSIRDVLAGNLFGVVIALERFERNGKTIEVERLFKYTVRDGKLAQCWVYDDDQRLIDEVFA